VVAKVRERLAVSKKTAKTFDVERFNLRKLSELEVRKQLSDRDLKQVRSFVGLKC
jgi:hypothetical protein